MNLDTHELAWTAGFVDGEGTFRFNTRKSQQRGVAFQVTQSDQRLLYRAQKALGLGNLHGPYGPYTTQRKPYWVLETSSFETVQAILAMLWRFLGPVKRAQGATMLQQAKETR